MMANTVRLQCEWAAVLWRMHILSCKLKPVPSSSIKYTIGITERSKMATTHPIRNQALERFGFIPKGGGSGSADSGEGPFPITRQFR